MGPSERTSLAVLTSGGDAPGMNAAVRAVVRTALFHGLDVYGIFEGYRGMVEGGDNIRPMTSNDVGGILHRGGTVIGSARCAEFRTREGRRTAARNLLERGIDALVVIGGDGSLTGANVFREEWAGLLEELVASGEIDGATAQAHPNLTLVGLVGSIDNDMFGTDMTIGADTALHRITEAIDAIQSTASSHQRSFVIEVMGRHCGYLALMSALATGANFVLIPESPPDTDEWAESMCRALEAGRAIGRRSNIVIVAEGAQDTNGNPITAQQVKKVLEDLSGEDTRVTSLGHVQRGGSPSAFDRYLSTVLGYAAVQHLAVYPDAEPQLIGIRGHQIVSSPLMESVAKTKSVANVIVEHDYEAAMEMRGGSFRDSFRMMRTMVRAHPHAPAPGQRRLRLAVLHGGGPAPGMNTAVRVAVRTGMDLGHTVLGVKRGFRGLSRGDVEEMDWMSVSGWVGRGGAELGTSRSVASPELLADVADDADAGLDGARRGADGVHARAAQPVQRGARNPDRQAGEQAGHARDVAVVLAGLVGAAEDHVGDRGPVDLGVARHQRTQRDRAQVVGSHARQGAAVAAEGGALRVADEGFVHDPVSCRWGLFSPRGVRRSGAAVRPDPGR